LPKILIAYYSKTGNTEKIAKLIAEGAKKVAGATIEVKNVQQINAKEATEADAFAFGSPAYFSMMSGPLLTLLTELYFNREKLAGKPMAAFATGGGSQAKTVEAIESILKALNPKIIQPGVAFGSTISKADEQQAKVLGEKLAKAAT
jgi:NAD(P)H dehydrogenase (quinone)